MDSNSSNNNNTFNTTAAASQSILERWMDRAPILASDMSQSSSWLLPSHQRPFVFFHIRKGGGSSLRSILWNSSRAFELDAWIPCQGGRVCVPFSLPPAGIHDRKAVYASHVNYAHMAQLMRETTDDPPTTTTRQAYRDGAGRERAFVYHAIDDDPRKPFASCLTNIRPTVSRVKSCWNYRFVEDAGKLEGWNLPAASNMTAEDWHRLLPEAVDRFGNGCNNEMARIFGNSRDERWVGHLSPALGRVFGDELETVLSRIAGCVVLRVDRCEESNAILRHFLPWVEGNICTTHQNSGHVVARTKLSDAARKAILAQNHFDELVFAFATELFEAQLAVAMEAELSTAAEKVDGENTGGGTKIYGLWNHTVTKKEGSGLGNNGVSLTTPAHD